jgi:signal transduction histidine kinase
MDFRAVFARDEESTRIGKMHGADRASNRSYILTEVIFEYHILREATFQLLEAKGPLGTAQRDIILDSIEQAVNGAAVEFSEVHADIQQKFINTLTHDLRNPITAAKMNADIIIKRSEASEPSIQSAKRIVGSLNRLSAMIHDLLDASRIRAGEPLSLHVTQGDLDAVIREVVDEMAIIHGDRFVLDSKGPLEGVWDGDALRRAVENLIGNAVKYGNSDTPITIVLRPGTAAAELIVHNEGPPISEAEIPLLFQIYRRSRSAQEGTKTGWGLGLTLVKGVVDAHKGSVRVESSLNMGTSFILSIPYQQDSLENSLRSAS